MDTQTNVPPDKRFIFLLRGYALALLFVAIASAFTLLLQRFFPYPILFGFFAAVMTSAWFGGTGPGLFAVLISTIVVDYFFVPPFRSFAIGAQNVMYFASFVVFCTGRELDQLGQEKG